MPVDIAPLKNDAIARELVRLRVGLNRPRTQVKLGPEEQYYFEQMAGAARYEALGALMGDVDYGRKNPTEQRDAILDTIAKSTRKARDEVLSALGEEEVGRRKEEGVLKRLPPTVQEQRRIDRPDGRE